MLGYAVILALKKRTIADHVQSGGFGDADSGFTG